MLVDPGQDPFTDELRLTYYGDMRVTFHFSVCCKKKNENHSCNLKVYKDEL